MRMLSTCLLNYCNNSTTKSSLQILRSLATATLPAVKAFREELGEELKAIKSAGTWKSERVITTKQGPKVCIEGRKQELLNFCANNYLGLSSHPSVIAAGQKALEKYGAGLSSVRFICGTQSIHKSLEKRISSFHSRPATILYPSCFDANAGLFEQILSPADAIISDELNHASIIDGIRLCKAKRYRYTHRDMSDLEAKLKEASAGGARRKLIASDGVFSMDGNIAPLPAICKLAKQYGALVFLDECHATGFFGSTGRGTEEYYRDQGADVHVDIINSTLGKALGGASGGYTTGDEEIVELLRQRGRPYLFSNSLAPPVVACAEEVAKNTTHFRSGMTKAGFTILGENHPICPVFLGDAKLAGNFADKMLDEGIYVIGFSFPVVPREKARIRVQISAAHETEDIERTIQAFIKVGKELGVVKG